MLDPEQLERAGDMVARVYQGIEAEMLDILVRAMVEGDGVTELTVSAAALLGQTHYAELREVIRSHAGEVDEELRKTVESHLKASDEADMAVLGSTEAKWPRQVEETVQGVARILARDNVAMVQGAVDAFFSASAEAITRVNTGSMTAERALHSAVRRLERQGIGIISYRNTATGTVTVRNQVDVAVRRHVRTQIAQDGARLTLRQMEGSGVSLVEVTSHADSRPEHAAWQGRVYSLKGDVTIDGKRYRDFYEATGYGTVTGLMGANCRHSFGPYIHGAPRLYEADPKHASGLDGETVYKYEQRQREQERSIRAWKREVRGAKLEGDEEAVASAKSGLRQSQARMRQLIEKANSESVTGEPVLFRNPAREWAGDA